MTDAVRVTRDLTRRLAVLGGVSTAAGAAMALSTRPAVRGFGQQTAMWGLVDLAIAAVSAARDPSAVRPERLRRILLVNAGLDVGYMTVGTAVALRKPTLGGRLSAGAATGHGTAIVLQGVALLVLDVVHARRLTSDSMVI